MLNILTFDIEDWVSSSIEIIPGGNKVITQKMIEKSREYGYANTKKILEILERYEQKATFFILTSFGEKYPSLIREIYNLGHEIGSHLHTHELVYKMTPKSFKNELKKSKAILEDIIGDEVISFRAPYFSIKPGSEWAFEVMVEVGIRYDSSIFSIKRKLYGYPGWQNEITKVETKSGDLWEIPITTWRFWKKFDFPIGGGGYFRILPYSLVRKRLSKIAKNKPIIVYFHPYEFNPAELQHPVFKGISQNFKFLQNFGRTKVTLKFQRLLNEFPFTSIKNFMENHGEE